MPPKADAPAGDVKISLLSSHSIGAHFMLLLSLVFIRAVGGEVAAVSTLAPKVGPIGLVCFSTFSWSTYKQ